MNNHLFFFNEYPLLGKFNYGLSDQSQRIDCAKFTGDLDFSLILLDEDNCHCYI
jgi:hypothetical protein